MQKVPDFRVSKQREINVGRPERWNELLTESLRATGFPE